jgi:hypothetical protein
MTTTTAATTARPRVTRARVGVAISALVCAFLLFDGVVHLLNLSQVQQAMRDLGYPTGDAVGIGVLELACLALYAVPRTRVLGAVLLTGYLGGAVSAQLRIGAPVGSTLLFPVYVGVAVWLGLYLRDAAVRRFLTGRG